MTNNTDMYYRFTSNTEPREEQLISLMCDIEKEVRERNSNLQSLIEDNILREYQIVKKKFPNL